MMMASVVRVAVLAYDGVDELDLFGAYSVLAKAAADSYGEQRTMAVRIVGDSARFTTSGGVSFGVHGGLAELADADVVVIPGGQGAIAAAADTRLCAALHEVGMRGAGLYAICSGSFLVAAAGLASDRKIAVHHAKRDQLNQFGATQVAVGLVRDGNVCSIGGDVTNGVKSVDLAFAVLADIAPDAVSVVSARMEIRPSRLDAVTAAPGAHHRLPFPKGR
jgi:AraC family transcriptional activator FtrA